MLGLGHSLVGGSLLDSVYSMTKSFSFDRVDDIFLTNKLSGTVPANGTMKPVSTSLCGAAWVNFDDGTADPYNSSSGIYTIIACSLNGGWKFQFTNKFFSGTFNLNNAADANIILASNYAKMRAPTSGSDYNRFLHKSDGWHLVVFTIDMSDPSTEVIGNLYVDGNRAQAGAQGQDGSSGVSQYGSQPEDSSSKKTSSASGGDITWRYDSDADRDEIDVTIGATANFNSSNNATFFNGNGWLGLIGDVAIWEGVVLTQDDIANLYNLHTPMDMSTIQSSNLRGYWRPTKGLDDSVSGATGTLVDDTAVVSEAPSLDVSGYAGYR